MNIEDDKVIKESFKNPFFENRGEFEKLWDDGSFPKGKEVNVNYNKINICKSLNKANQNRILKVVQDNEEVF